MGKIPKQTFFQRRYTYGQWAHENMLCITNHQRNASKNHSVTSYLLGWLSSKRPQKTNVDKDVEERMCGKDVEETPVHCWWGCKLVQPLQKTIWRFLKKLKSELRYDPEISLLDIYPKKTKLSIQEIHAPQFSQHIFLQEPGMWK